MSAEEENSSGQLDSVWRPAANDLWIRRRLEMDSLLAAADQLEAEGAADLRDFLRFLASECVGAEFTNDRQWGELLNLMQISRKLNHRSVKLADLMRNRQVIEANKHQIRRLNRAAKLTKTIEESLGQLDATIESCKLKLPADCTGSRLVFVGAAVAEASGELHDKCWPTWRTIKSALRTELATERSGRSQLELWEDRCRRQETILTSLAEFLDQFESLESNLAQLGPLVMAGQPVEAAVESDSSVIKSCKRTFNSVLVYRRELLASLGQLAPRVRTNPKSRSDTRMSIGLSKLLSSRGKIENELYSSELIRNRRALDECRRQLDETLRNLRLEFGRFYFVSDLELLTIVALDSQLVLLSERAEIQRLVAKLFNNSISGFVLRGDKFVAGVTSPIGETLLFSEQELVPIKKKINVYSVEVVRILNEVGRKLRRCLCNRLMTGALNEAAVDWELPVQLITLSAYIRFTRKVEMAVREPSAGAFERLIEDYEDNLGALNERRKSVTDRLVKLKCAASASQTVHFISTLRKLAADKLREVNDWSWQRQLRYYVANGTVEVHIAGSKFEYKFDYLPVQVEETATSGNELEERRLVSTRTTESCVLVASYAVGQLGSGANPFGPAGSGKTETIKALGQLLGRQVIVHNCDDSNDADSLARLVLGLAHTGLWGCFDEFNRLSASVMSSVSGLLERVQSGIRRRKPTVELSSGQLVCVDEASAYFITLNPSDDAKYRGRRRLPANLRSLFLPVAMTDVQIEEIVCESLMALADVRLKSEEAAEISHKFNLLLETMRGASESSSATQTCSWDLRLAVAILRRFKLLAQDKARGEFSLAQRFGLSILIEVESRLDKQQAEILRELVADHFKFSSSIEEHADNSLQAELLSLASGVHKISDSELSKVVAHSVALHQQLETRTGVALLGPRGSGKTLSWRLLSSALGESVEWFALNPRSCSKEALFGCFDLANQKWIDGILSGRLRAAQEALASSSSLAQVWIVLDGPVDPDWVEQLNSVLDENKTLTLGSGERINFCPAQGKSIKLIFETRHLQFASPATISRLGSVLLEDRDQSGAPRLESMADLRTALNNKEVNNLMIVETDRPDLLELGATTEYICNRHSRAEHLIEWLTKHKAERLVVVKNVQLIEPADCWGSRSFVELLKFIASYNLIYRSNEPTEIGSHLLVTCDSLANCSSWSPVEATLVSVPPLGLMRSASNSFDALIAMIEDDDLPAILTVYSNQRSTSRRAKIAASLRGRFVVKEFASSADAHQTVAEIEQINSSVRPPVEGSRSAYLISAVEFNLMSDVLQSRVMHSLNEFKSNSCNAKFIFLCNSDQTSGTDLAFWSSIGASYSLEDESPSQSSTSSSIADYELSSGSGKQSIWLKSRLGQLFSEHFAGPSDIGQFESLLAVTFDTLATFKANVDASSRNLTIGLSRLETFEANIQKVSVRLAQKQEQMRTRKSQLELKDREVEQMLASLRSSQWKLAEARSQHASQEEEVKRRSREVELQLASATKLVEQSKENVGKFLRPEALNEVKSLRAPPKTIKDILDVLFVLLGVGDSSWAAAKAYLTRVSLRDELAKFDFRTRLSAEILRRVEAEIKSKRESFDLKKAAKASSAVVPIVQWIEAAQAYGRVLVEVEPLRSELQRLTRDLGELEQTSERLERETAALDAKVAEANAERERMRTDLEAVEESVATGELEIAGAREALRSVASQMGKWRQRLERLKLASQDDRLPRLSAYSAYLATSLDETSDSLSRSYFDLNSQDDSELFAQIVSLLQDTELDLRVFRDDIHKSTLRSLLVARLLVGSRNCARVPLIELSNSLGATDLAKTLGYKDILASESEIELVHCGSGRDSWREAVDVAAKLDKLVALQLHDATSDLDVVDLINSRDSSDLRLVLLADAGDHIHLGAFTRAIKLQLELKSLEEVQVALTSRLIERLDHKLSQRIEQLELRMQAARDELKNLERTLIQNLALNGEVDSDIDHALIDILDKLRVRGEQLESDLKSLGEERSSLGAQREDYAGVAMEAASFYIEYIADLGEKCRFYRTNLDAYVDRLLPDDTTEPTATGPKIKINFESAIQSALSSMKPAERLELATKLARRAIGTSQPVGSVDLERATRAALLSLGRRQQVPLSETATHWQRAPTSNRLQQQQQDWSRAQLMFVVHEPTSSSPLVALDDLFARLEDEREASNHKASGRVDYRKVYASSDSNEQLDWEISRLFGARKGVEQDSVGCLCVANAQLAASWLNSKLPTVLARRLPDECPSVLLILVAESSAVASSTSAADCQSFESSLIELARVRFWHDELALDFVRRFDLLAESPAIDERKFAGLKRQVVLLHVVCQELVRRTRGQASGSLPGGWSRPYAFDSDQLRLAIRMLDALGADQDPVDEKEVSESLARRLEALVYGARFECEQDARLFAKLAARFLQIGPAAESMWRQVAELRKLEGEERVDLWPARHAHAIGRLIDHEGH